MAVPTVENQTFYVGQVFDDYDSFKTALRKFERATNTKFSIRRCDKIDVRPGYSSVQLGCKHYGKKRINNKLTGERPKQKTYKIGCEAHIILRRTDDKQKLYIDQMQLNHSHATTAITARGYPENRRLSKESKEKVESLQKLGVKPTLRPLLRTLEQDPNKLFLGRDISNIGTVSKKRVRNGRSDEEMLRDKLEEIRQRDPDASLHIETDPVTGEVLFIFIQTSDMRENLTKFPEVLLMDTTYKINENRMPVSVIDVMDGEGEGLVAGYAFLSNETQGTLSSMLRYFVNVSGERSFDRTECCVVDKDFSEIAAIKEVLPHVAMHICSVHTEKNFKKLAKGHPNKKECIELMKALIYCDSQEKFDETYNNLRSIAASEMMATFDKNWLNCQQAWSLKDKILVMNLKNNSTNRVERHNRLLKTVFNVNTALYEAVEGIVNRILANKKDDRLYKMHEALTKKTDINTCSDPIVEVICNDLTDYASKIVCEQLLLSRKPSPLPFQYNQTETSCTCTLFKYFKLPCRHIMRYLRQQGMLHIQKE